MHVHLDAVGGIAGDMFLAACLDAWPELAEGLEQPVRAAGLPADWNIEIADARSHGIAGTRVRFISPPDADRRPTGRHREIRERLESSALPHDVAAGAVAIFALLAEAEAASHGVEVDDVHFHEIADWDSVADIVGAAWVIKACGAASWSVSPLPLGGGLVATAHGNLPVPAPATARLLQGMEMVDDGIPGERVTPTGAAILRHLRATCSRPPDGAMGRTGHGLGTRELPDRPNMLRLLAVEQAVRATDRPWNHGEVTVITFEVDDQTPESLAVALDQLRSTDGVLDVVQSAITGKKGRVGSRIQLLCRPEVRDTAISACFEQTTTIGLRWHDEHRAELPRRLVEREGVPGKAVVRPGGPSAKPEMDHIARSGSTQLERDAVTAQFIDASDGVT